ncbi:MAG: type I restriction endonuclease subunit R [Thermoguttaceae bacterium]|nr:type I restriction endonuclease subunit R [Thermoguttaceae bacterium]
MTTSDFDYDADLCSEANASQRPALELLQKLGFEYLTPQECAKERGGSYRVLLENVLREQLRRLNVDENGKPRFSDANIRQAVAELDAPLGSGLKAAGKAVYEALVSGKTYAEIVDGRSKSYNLKYVDWERPERNALHVTREFTVANESKKNVARPDLVLFVNGIPLAVVECKAADKRVEDGVAQILRDQSDDYVPQLYKFAQITMATNKNAVKYATPGTPAKYWSVWKEEDEAFLNDRLARFVVERTPTQQDRALVSLFSPERLFELVRFFVLFDGAVKKIARFQQYFAVQAVLKRIEERDENGRRRGGVVWHTQGSGKSLTMAMLTQYLQAKLAKHSPRIVVVTDRKELDAQITQTFARTRLPPARATSGANLKKLVNDPKYHVVTCLINKFAAAEKQGARCESSDVFVLVDESHRANYGDFATKMRRVFPNGCYIGFTGTPLMKKDKNTAKAFGGEIHRYTIQDGVDDKAIVPLLYEGRFVEQEVDEKNIDLWFDEITKRLNDAQKEDLKRKRSSIKRLTSTEARIKRIALDVARHFTQNVRPLGCKAMLAVNYKRDAVRYLRCFETFGDVKAAVVISAPDLREDATDDVDSSADQEVLRFWRETLANYGDADAYENAVKRKFCEGDDGVDLLIVCGKLLTGFDAPICQTIYLDKQLKEHGLLQAIARANRLRDGKDYGLIVDYRGLLLDLNKAMDMYADAGGLNAFDAADLRGAVVDVLSVVGELRGAFSNLESLFASLKNNRDVEEIEVFLADAETRERFYSALRNFGRALHKALSSDAVCNEIGDELERCKKAFAFFSKIRRDVKIRYADALDGKEYEPLIQNLLDEHLRVKDLTRITEPVDILKREDFERELGFLASPRAKAEAIANRLTKSIKLQREKNPAYYDAFSKRIADALAAYKNKTIADAQFLEIMNAILKDYRDERPQVEYPSTLNDSPDAQAIYGAILPTLSDAKGDVATPELVAEIALGIAAIFERGRRVDWRKNDSVNARLAQEIDDLLYRYEDERLGDLTSDERDKTNEIARNVALARSSR